MNSRAVAVFLFLSFNSLPNAQEPPLTFNLQEAVDHALAHSERVAVAEEAVGAAEARIASAQAGLWPSVNITGSYTYAGKLPKQVLDFGDFGGDFGELPMSGEAGATEPVTEDPAQSDPLEIEFGTRDDYRAIGQLNWSIFTWGKTRNGIRSARDARTAEEHRLNATRRVVSLAATEAFYGVLMARESVGVAEQAREQAERRLSTAELRVKAGAATQLDLLQAKVALARASSQAIRARNGLKLARRGFAVALGERPDFAFRVEGAFNLSPVEASLERLLETALESRDELKEIAAREASAEYMFRIAQAGNKPNVALTWTGTWNDTEKQDPQTTWSAGVGVSFPIFDGFATRAQTREARAAMNQTGLSRDALQRGVALEVHQAHLSYQEANAVLAAQEEAVIQADEALRIANLSFENGMLTSVELADAELQKTQTQLSRLQALHDAVVARARLARAVAAPLR